MLPAKRKIPVRFLPLALLAFLPTLCVRAQESSSRPIANASSAAASAPGSPTAALRDAISAACSQSEQAFAKSLTARNADTFAHLTPSARVAFMKRFVLLNEPGKPSLLPNPSGRPIVHCQTPAGAAELQIGGAETADNLAFLPVEVRDATDTVGNSAVRVKMGLVRENGEWKLLSVGLLLLDLPTLAFESKPTVTRTRAFLTRWASSLRLRLELPQILTPQDSSTPTLPLASETATNSATSSLAEARWARRQNTK